MMDQSVVGFYLPLVLHGLCAVGILLAPNLDTVRVQKGQSLILEGKDLAVRK